MKIITVCDITHTMHHDFITNASIDDKYKLKASPAAEERKRNRVSSRSSRLHNFMAEAAAINP
jgi:hypothetical protein